VHSIKNHTKIVWTSNSNFSFTRFYESSVNMLKYLVSNHLWLFIIVAITEILIYKRL